MNLREKESEVFHAMDTFYDSDRINAIEADLIEANRAGVDEMLAYMVANEIRALKEENKK